MKGKEVIQICAITIDANKIGYEGLAHLLVTGSPGKSLSDAMERLKKSENIIVATKTIGDYEGYAILVFKSATDLYERVHQIKSMTEIEKIEVSFTAPVPSSIPFKPGPVVVIK